MPGTSRFSRRTVPVNVPLVPMQVTKCVMATRGLLDNLDRGAVEVRLPVGRIVVLVRIEIGVRDRPHTVRGTSRMAPSEPSPGSE